MKKIMIIALVIGVCTLTTALGQNQEDELQNLKKQVTTLKNKNAKLERNTYDLKNSLKTLNENVTAKLNDFDGKLTAISDSVKAKEQIIMKTQNRTELLSKSLKKRKKLCIIAFIIGIVLVIAGSAIVIMKYKKDAKKQDTLIAELKKGLANDINKAKSDLQSQINSAKDGLEEKIKDQDKKISALKK